MTKRLPVFTLPALILCSCLNNTGEVSFSFKIGPPEDYIDMTHEKPHSALTGVPLVKTAPEPDSASGLCFERIRLGSERLFDPPYFSLIEGKRIAIMANQTSLATVDRLIGDRRTALAAIFAPEHGLLGTAAAGERIENGAYRGIPVYACYGDGDQSRRIKSGLLDGIDVLLFEIQDIGTRHYTFISSMYLAMDSAADAGVTFVVLDRPDAVNGVNIEGPVLDPSLQTFVGIGSIPNRYAMTVGELALLFKNEAAVMDGPRYPRKNPDDPYYNVRDLKLVVVPMSGYDRTRCYDEQAGIGAWIPPSPNIPSVNAALCYVGAGLLDGNTIAEIVGGLEQFSHIGFPFIKTAAELEDFITAAQELYDFPGVTLEPAVNPRTHAPNVVRLSITDRARFNPTRTALALLYAQLVHYPREAFFTSPEGEVMFRKIHGNTWFAAVRGENGRLPGFDEILGRIGEDEKKFSALREKYLLY